MSTTCKSCKREIYIAVQLCPFCHGQLIETGPKQLAQPRKADTASPKLPDRVLTSEDSGEKITAAVSHLSSAEKDQPELRGSRVSGDWRTILTRLKCALLNVSGHALLCGAAAGTVCLLPSIYQGSSSLYEFSVSWPLLAVAARWGALAGGSTRFVTELFPGSKLLGRCSHQVSKGSIMILALGMLAGAMCSVIAWASGAGTIEDFGRFFPLGAGVGGAIAFLIWALSIFYREKKD